MMKNEKKYFTIAEVSNLTGLPAHKIRYLEKSNKFLPIITIRSRRYYTTESVDYLLQNYPINEIVHAAENYLTTSVYDLASAESITNKFNVSDGFNVAKSCDNQQILLQIDTLINNLQSLLSYAK